jgi:hypothetical protein
MEPLLEPLLNPIVKPLMKLLTKLPLEPLVVFPTESPAKEMGWDLDY